MANLPYFIGQLVPGFLAYVLDLYRPVCTPVPPRISPNWRNTCAKLRA
ncbi:hypothetical protein [Streptomyces angustmyceticus]